MTTTAALSIIGMIADNANLSPYPSTDARACVPLAEIKNVLEDGQALAALGVTDDDLGAVEDAHDTVKDWLRSGLAYYHDAA